jgi:hypothetical protein
MPAISLSVYNNIFFNGTAVVHFQDCMRIMTKTKEKMTGAIHGYTYVANIETTRPATDFTARIIPQHTEAQIPAEASLIVWQR